MDDFALVSCAPLQAVSYNVLIGECSWSLSLTIIKIPARSGRLCPLMNRGLLYDSLKLPNSDQYWTHSSGGDFAPVSRVYVKLYPTGVPIGKCRLNSRGRMVFLPRSGSLCPMVKMIRQLSNVSVALNEKEWILDCCFDVGSTVRNSLECAGENSCSRYPKSKMLGF